MVLPKCMTKFLEVLNSTEIILILTMHFMYGICKQSLGKGRNPPLSLKLLQLLVGIAEHMLITQSSHEEHPDSCKALIHDGLFWTLSNNWHIPPVRIGLQSLSPPWQCNALLCTLHMALNLSLSPPPPPQINSELPPTSFCMVMCYITLLQPDCLLLQGMYSNAKDSFHGPLITWRLCCKNTVKRWSLKKN